MEMNLLVFLLPEVNRQQVYRLPSNKGSSRFQAQILRVLLQSSSSKPQRNNKKWLILPILSFCSTFLHRIFPRIKQGYTIRVQAITLESRSSVLSNNDGTKFTRYQVRNNVTGRYTKKDRLAKSPTRKYSKITMSTLCIIGKNSSL